MSFKDIVKDFIQEKYLLASSALGGVFQYVSDSQASLGVIMAVLSFLISAYITISKGKAAAKLAVAEAKSKEAEQEMARERHEFEMARDQKAHDAEERRKQELHDAKLRQMNAMAATTEQADSE